MAAVESPSVEKPREPPQNRNNIFAERALPPARRGPPIARYRVAAPFWIWGFSLGFSTEEKFSDGGVRATFERQRISLGYPARILSKGKPLPRF